MQLVSDVVLMQDIRNECGIAGLWRWEWGRDANQNARAHASLALFTKRVKENSGEGS
jgi:hypothetical protein